MSDLIAGLNEWQIYGITTWLFLQALVFAAVPEEIIILTVGVLLAQGRVRLPLAFLSIELGLLTANSGLVFIASRFSEKKIFQKDSIRRALLLFRKHGNWMIFVCRFTPFLRGAVYAAVGLSGMRVRDFFKTDALASCFQVPLLLLIGAWIGEKTGSIEKAAQVIGIAALSIAALALIGVLLRNRISKIAR